MNPLRFETEQIIKPLLKEVRSINKKLDKKTKIKIYKIQDEILDWIIDSEYRIKGIKESIKSISEFTKSTKNMDKKIKENVPFKLYQTISSNLSQEIKEYSDRINILKSFMDSILWKFCSNVELKYLSLNEKESPIIGKTGLFHELTALQRLIKKYEHKKRLFILSDLTHCVKTSDIIGISELGIKYLIECKSGLKEGKRYQRQKTRAEKLAEFFKKGKIKWDYSNYYDIINKTLNLKPKKKNSITTKMTGFKFEYEFTSMEKCIQDAKSKGFSSIKVNDCITFVGRDLTKNDSDNLSDKQIKLLQKYSRRQLTPKIIDKMEEKGFFQNIKSKVTTNPRNKGTIFLFDVCQYCVYTKYRYYHYRPFATFDISEDSISSLLLDQVIFLVQLNLNQLIGRLNKVGLKAKFYNKPVQFLLVENKKGEKYAVEDLFFKLGHEVMSIDSFVNLLRKFC